MELVQEGRGRVWTFKSKPLFCLVYRTDRCFHLKSLVLSRKERMERPLNLSLVTLLLFTGSEVAVVVMEVDES